IARFAALATAPLRVREAVRVQIEPHRGHEGRRLLHELSPFRHCEPPVRGSTRAGERGYARISPGLTRPNYALDPDTLVRRVRPLLAVQLPHGLAATVVEPDQVPFLIEDGAPRAAALGGRAVVNETIVPVEEDVVVQRDRKGPASGVTDDVDLL